MRRALLPLVAGALLVACGGGSEGPDVPVPGHAGARKSSAAVRAARRAFDGAPPVIPHDPLPGDCAGCHDERGLAVEGLGFAPPSPHQGTPGLSSIARCAQCHVYRTTDELFVANAFAGLPQDLRRGERAFEGAPPVIPHDTFLRSNCRACHAGPAAREEIRTSHPERDRCTQCHVPSTHSPPFVR